LNGEVPAIWFLQALDLQV